jgi:hypothetical protein
MSAVRTTARQITLLGLVLIAFSASRCFADIWMAPGDVLSGTLTYGDLEIIAYDGWKLDEPDGGTSLYYEVSRPLDESLPLHYLYTFTAPTPSGGHGLSHIIIEVSYGGELGSFTLEAPDYYGPTGDNVEVGDYYPTFDKKTGLPSKPNPYMPDDGIFGVKFEGMFDEGTEEEPITSWTIDFYSRRLPMQGDFFAVDGSGDAIDDWAVAYNSGFGSLDGAKILVPNSEYVPVTGAFLLGMIGLGIAGVKMRKFA